MNAQARGNWAPWTIGRIARLDFGSQPLNIQSSLAFDLKSGAVSRSLGLTNVYHLSIFWKLNRPGFEETQIIESRHRPGWVQGNSRLILRRRDVAQGAEEATVVEPVHPFQRSELEVITATPVGLRDRVHQTEACSTTG